MAALEPIFEPERLSQGRWHARAGRVVRLELAEGGLLARLEGGQAVPRAVRLRLTPLADAQWDRVLAGLAGEARYGALLLAGELPPDVDDVFAAAGARLFPRARRLDRVSTWSSSPRPRGFFGREAGWHRGSVDLASSWSDSSGPRSAWLEAGDVALSCTCSDARKAPCKHLAAVCYAAAARLDGDPFLLFALRGRTRTQVLAALRARRASAAPAEPAVVAVVPPAAGAPEGAFAARMEAAYDAIAALAARLAEGKR